MDSSPLIDQAWTIIKLYKVVMDNFLGIEKIIAKEKNLLTFQKHCASQQISEFVISGFFGNNNIILKQIIKICGRSFEFPLKSNENASLFALFNRNKIIWIFRINEKYYRSEISKDSAIVALFRYFVDFGNVIFFCLDEQNISSFNPATGNLYRSEGHQTSKFVFGNSNLSDCKLEEILFESSLKNYDGLVCSRSHSNFIARSTTIIKYICEESKKKYMAEYEKFIIRFMSKEQDFHKTFKTKLKKILEKVSQKDIDDYFKKFDHEFLVFFTLMEEIKLFFSKLLIDLGKKMKNMKHILIKSKHEIIPLDNLNLNLISEQIICDLIKILEVEENLSIKKSEKDDLAIKISTVLGLCKTKRNEALEEDITNYGNDGINEILSLVKKIKLDTLFKLKSVLTDLINHINSNENKFPILEIEPTFVRIIEDNEKMTLRLVDNLGLNKINFEIKDYIQELKNYDLMNRNYNEIIQSIEIFNTSSPITLIVWINTKLKSPKYSLCLVSNGKTKILRNWESDCLFEYYSEKEKSIILNKDMSTIHIFELNAYGQKNQSERNIPILNLETKYVISMAFAFSSSIFYFLTSKEEVFKVRINDKNNIQQAEKMKSINKNRKEEIIKEIYCFDQERFIILQSNLNIYIRDQNFNNPEVYPLENNENFIGMKIFNDSKNEYLLILQKNKVYSYVVKNLVDTMNIKAKVNNNFERKKSINNIGNPLLDITFFSINRFGNLSDFIGCQTKLDIFIIVPKEVEIDEIKKFKNEFNSYNSNIGNSFFQRSQFLEESELTIIDGKIPYIKCPYLNDLLISRIALHICTIENNKFLPISGGILNPSVSVENTQEIYKKSSLIDFGLIEAYLINKTLESDNFLLIGIMGRQSSGKSYLCNRLFGTRFAVSAKQCTNGIWISYAKIGNKNLLIFDCEGLFSVGKTENDEVKLIAVLTSLCDVVLINQDLGFSRHFNELFNHLEKVFDKLRGNDLFKGTPIICVRDVTTIDQGDGQQEFMRNYVQNVSKTRNRVFRKIFNNKIKGEEREIWLTPFNNFENIKFDSEVENFRNELLLLQGRFKTGQDIFKMIKLILTQLHTDDNQLIDKILKDEALKARKNEILKMWNCFPDENDYKIEIQNIEIIYKQNLIQISENEDSNSLISKCEMFIQNYFQIDENHSNFNNYYNSLNEFIIRLLEERYNYILNQCSVGDMFSLDEKDKIRSEIEEKLSGLKIKIKLCPEKKCSLCSLRCILNITHKEDYFRLKTEISTEINKLDLKDINSEDDITSLKNKELNNHELFCEKIEKEKQNEKDLDKIIIMKNKLSILKSQLEQKEEKLININEELKLKKSEVKCESKLLISRLIDEKERIANVKELILLLNLDEFNELEKVEYNLNGFLNELKDDKLTLEKIYIIINDSINTDGIIELNENIELTIKEFITIIEKNKISFSKINNDFTEKIERNVVLLKEVDQKLDNLTQFSVKITTKKKELEEQLVCEINKKNYYEQELCKYKEDIQSYDKEKNEKEKIINELEKIILEKNRLILENSDIEKAIDYVKNLKEMSQTSNIKQSFNEISSLKCEIDNLNTSKAMFLEKIETKEKEIKELNSKNYLNLKDLAMHVKNDENNLFQGKISEQIKRIMKKIDYYTINMTMDNNNDEKISELKEKLSFLEKSESIEKEIAEQTKILENFQLNYKQKDEKIIKIEKKLEEIENSASLKLIKNKLTKEFYDFSMELNCQKFLKEKKYFEISKLTELNQRKIDLELVIIDDESKIVDLNDLLVTIEIISKIKSQGNENKDMEEFEKLFSERQNILVAIKNEEEVDNKISNDSETEIIKDSKIDSTKENLNCEKLKIESMIKSIFGDEILRFYDFQKHTKPGLNDYFYSFQNLNGNVILIEKWKNLWMEKIIYEFENQVDILAKEIIESCNEKEEILLIKKNTLQEQFNNILQNEKEIEENKSALAELLNNISKLTPPLEENFNEKINKISSFLNHHSESINKTNRELEETKLIQLNTQKINFTLSSFNDKIKKFQDEIFNFYDKNDYNKFLSEIKLQIKIADINNYIVSIETQISKLELEIAKQEKEINELNLDPNLTMEMIEINLKNAMIGLEEIKKNLKKLETMPELLKKKLSLLSDLETIDDRIKKSCDCKTDHKCKFFCEACSLEIKPQCNFEAGHVGYHLCQRQDHICKETCQLYEQCSKLCRLNFGHPNKHNCNLPHNCQQICAYCSRPCKEGLENHKIHLCDAQQCPHKCVLCENLCSSNHHDHDSSAEVVKVGDSLKKLHLCNKEHNCGKNCESDGICKIDYLSENKKWHSSFSDSHWEYEYIKPIAKKNQCVLKIPVDRLTHEGACLCNANNVCKECEPCIILKNHRCNAQCPQCGSYCSHTKGHSGKHKTNHRNMEKCIFVAENKDKIITLEDPGLKIKTYKAADNAEAEYCYSNCQRKGRGHYHLSICPGGEECGQIKYPGHCLHSESVYYPDVKAHYDMMLCETFWAHHGFELPMTNPKSLEEVKLCNYYCDKDHSIESATKKKLENEKYFCKEHIWHSHSKLYLHHNFDCKHQYVNKIQICIMMDLTASMDVYLQEAKQSIQTFVGNIKKNIKNSEIPLEIAFVGFTDHDPDKVKENIDENIVQIINFCTESEILTIIEKIVVSGGFDQCEAVFDGLFEVNKLSWDLEDSCKRFAFFVMDAPPHGEKFYDKPTKEDLAQFEVDIKKNLDEKISAFEGETMGKNPLFLMLDSLKFALETKVILMEKAHDFFGSKVRSDSFPEGCPCKKDWECILDEINRKNINIFVAKMNFTLEKFISILNEFGLKVKDSKIDNPEEMTKFMSDQLVNSLIDEEYVVIKQNN